MGLISGIFPKTQYNQNGKNSAISMYLIHLTHSKINFEIKMFGLIKLQFIHKLHLFEK